MPSFFFKGHGHPRAPPSFPTRRSSDLPDHRRHPLQPGRPGRLQPPVADDQLEARSEQHTSELQSRLQLVCPLFFLKDTATPELPPLSLPDALPISRPTAGPRSSPAVLAASSLR